MSLRYSIFPILFVIFAFILSGFSFAVLFTALVIFCGILLEYKITPNRQKQYCLRLLFIVFGAYVISCLLFAPAFEDGKYYMLIDSTQYFSLLKMTHMDLDVQGRLESCYLKLDDSDALHLIYVRYLILFANNTLNGANVTYLMLTNAFWGIMASAAIFRLLTRVTTPKKAFAYTLAFALLSPYHFYSIGYVRDIIIASFYVHAIELSVGKFNIWKLLVLILMAGIVWGIRLYSGLFLFVFVAISLYNAFGNYKVFQNLSVIIAVLAVLITIPVIIRSELFNQAAEELEFYQEYNQGQMTSSSLSRVFENLPHGPREIGLVLFSQMQPFPFWDNLKNAENLNQVYIGSVSGVHGIYWFFISFSLFLIIFVKKFSKQLILEDWVFLAICLVFILINTVQIHVRRIMPVYPLMLYLYVKMMDNCPYKRSKRLVNGFIRVSYVVLLVTYIFIKS